MTQQLPSWPATPPACGSVVLREFTGQDAHLATELGDDPYIPLIGSLPARPTARQALERIRRQRGRLAEGTGLSFAIADARSGTAVGAIGLWLRNLLPPHRTRRPLPPLRRARRHQRPHQRPATTKDTSRQPACPLTSRKDTSMLTHDNRRSLPRGNPPVPSRWQATCGFQVLGGQAMKRSSLMAMSRRGARFAAAMVALGAAGVAAAASAADAGAVPAAPSAVPAAGSWGRAIAVPGLRALNKRGGAGVVSVSCASAANCAAGGHYSDRHGHGQGFVASERHGRWSKAIEVPGLGALNSDGGADVSSVSCGAAGNCAAGGFFSDEGLPFDRPTAFIAAEHGGRWGKAVALEDGEVSSVSCASAGNCLAGGYAGPYVFVGDAFVVVERAGRWGRVRLVPGLRALEHGGDPEIAGSWISSVACPSAGNCAVGGGYSDKNGNNHGFVAVERHGVWDKAIEVPGLAALNKRGGDTQVWSVSCGSAGSCAAGGYYTDSNGHYQGFAVLERNGAWGTAIEVPGLGALNKGSRAAVNWVSCGSAGSCVAGGAYAGGFVAPAPSGRLDGFVAVERNGVWHRAIEVPGLAALSRGGDAFVTSVSCASAGSCAAGGYYTGLLHHRQGFVAVERHGVWGKATRVPGLRALNAGGSATVGSLSCPSPGHCAAGGSFRDRSGHRQGFVTQAR